jgi:predicted DNA-binding transcriptional regulator YafY
MRRADRMIKLVHYLRRMRRAVTAQRIADDFGICQRTVYRDIHDLMNSGVPIFGEAGVGYVIDKKYHLPPVMFDHDELEAIGLGIAMVRSWTDEKFAEKANSALEKIQAVLPEHLLNEIQQLALLSVPSTTRSPWRVSFSDIRECIRNKQKIVFSYLDQEDQPSKRKVRPLGLVFLVLFGCW